MKRRAVLTTLATLASLTCLTAPVLAQTPTLAGKTLRIIVPSTAGGPTDVQARALATELTKILSMTVIVDNRGGAGGAIGAAEAARAAPDGLTLLYSPDFVMTQTPHTILKLAYDPFKFAPVLRTAVAGTVMYTSPTIPAKTVKEFVEYARNSKTPVSYASYGIGTTSHIYGAMLAKAGGFEAVHIPYKGTADAVADLMSGRVQFSFNAISLASQYVPSGKLNALAVAGEKRVKPVLDVPTMGEAGYPGFESIGWIGVFAPAGTSPDIVKTYHAAFVTALKSPEIIKVWETQGFEFSVENSSQVAEIVRNEHKKFGGLFRDAGIVPQ